MMNASGGFEKKAVRPAAAEMNGAAVCCRGGLRPGAGFTLIELMVSIAIIALLISFLLPALTASREAGRRVLCASHLRQIGLGMEMYADANGGFYMQGYPVFSASSAYRHVGSYPWHLDRGDLLRVSSGVFHCPSRQTRAIDEGGRTIGDWYAGGSDAMPVPVVDGTLARDVWRTVDYGANVFVVTGWNGSDPATYSNSRPAQRDQLQAGRVLAAESSMASDGWRGISIVGTTLTANLAWTVHGSMGQVLWQDASVRGVQTRVPSRELAAAMYQQSDPFLGFRNDPSNRWTRSGQGGVYP